MVGRWIFASAAGGEGDPGTVRILERSRGGLRQVYCLGGGNGCRTTSNPAIRGGSWLAFDPATRTIYVAASTGDGSAIGTIQVTGSRLRSVDCLGDMDTPVEDKVLPGPCRRIAPPLSIDPEAIVLIPGTRYLAIADRYAGAVAILRRR